MTTTLVAESEMSTRAPSGANASRFGSGQAQLKALGDRPRGDIDDGHPAVVAGSGPKLRTVRREIEPFRILAGGWNRGHLPVGGPAAAPSTRLSVFDSRLAVRMVSRSRLRTIMWAPSRPSPSNQSTSSASGS